MWCASEGRGTKKDSDMTVYAVGDLQGCLDPLKG